MLQVTNLGFSYRRGPQVLDNISFSLQTGHTTCLLGPNGAGKSTLLRCLLGLTEPSSGTILIDGADVASLNRKERSKLMAYVPQNSAISFPYSVYQVVLMGRTAHLRFAASPTKADHHSASDALERLGISHLAERPFHKTSGGQQQLALIARAIAQQAQVLVLDEPTAALDLANQIRVLNIIRSLAEEKLTVLMTSHTPDHAFMVSQDVLLLRDGTIGVQGPTEQTLTSASLTQLYNTEVEVVQAPSALGRQDFRLCAPILESSTVGEPLSPITKGTLNDVT